MSIKQRVFAAIIAFSFLFIDLIPYTVSAEPTLICEKQEHTHTPDCFERRLVCELPTEQNEPEKEFVSTFHTHKHTDSCRDSNGNIVCGYVENAYYHKHNEFCKDQEGNIVCGLKNKTVHKHTEECYQEETVLVCDLPESDEHFHSDECYATKKVMICDLATENHTHSPECFDASGKVICGESETPEFVSSEENWKVTDPVSNHTHTEDCYETTENLICGMEEHVHTQECYQAYEDIEPAGEEIDDSQVEQSEPQDNAKEEPDPPQALNEPSVEENESSSLSAEESPDPSEDETPVYDSEPVPETTDEHKENEPPIDSLPAGEPDKQQTDEDVDSQRALRKNETLSVGDRISCTLFAEQTADILVKCGKNENIRITIKSETNDFVINTDIPDKEFALDTENNYVLELTNIAFRKYTVSITATQDTSFTICAEPLEINEEPAETNDLTSQQQEDSPSDVNSQDASVEEENINEINSQDTPAEEENISESPIQKYTITSDESSPYNITASFTTKTILPENSRLIAQETTEKETDMPAPKKVRQLRKTGLSAQDPTALDIPSMKVFSHTNEPEITIFKKTIDISLVADEKAVDPDPESKIEITIALPDLEDGQNVQVSRVLNDATEPLDSKHDGHSVTFESDMLTQFVITSYAQKIATMESDSFTVSVYGKNNKNESQNTQEQILDVQEGLSVLNAYSLNKDDNHWVIIDETSPIGLNDRECVSLYAVENNTLGSLVIDSVNPSDTIQFNLSDLSDFALVLDSGYRHRAIEVSPEGIDDEKIKETLNGTAPTILLDGLVPKNAVAAAVDVSDQYTIQDIKSNTSDITDDYSLLAIYDISICDENGEYEPDDLHPITVNITDNRIQDTNNIQVVHILDNGSVEQVSDFIVNNGNISFVATGFSAYAIVDGPGQVAVGCHVVSSYDELNNIAQSGFYIAHWDYYYMTNEQVNNIGGTSGRTGIRKTKPSNQDPLNAGAALYYFETVDAEAHQYKIYCLDENGQPQFVKWVTGNVTTMKSISFTTAANATTFIVEPFNDTLAGAFKIHALGSDYYWNMQGGANGAGIAAYNSATDNNAKLRFVYRDTIEEDPYGLQNKSFGLISWNGGVTGHAMMAEENAGALQTKNLTVLTKKDNHADKLLVPNESDITFWSFTWVNDLNYYITTQEDGETKYLSITENGLSLVDAANARPVEIIAGSGNSAGMICLRTGTNTLTYSGSEEGFITGGTAGREWLYLTEESELTADYYMTYSSRKVSVSDESVTNGSRIIVYTRTWNDETKRYEFYAIDHDGSLVRCFESGDSIQWIGNRINSLLWNLVEYYWEGTDDPNFYYDLYNQYSEKFLAPQTGNGQILSDNPIGVNLNGRQRGAYFSTIFAWDNYTQSFSGLKVESDNNGDMRIVACDRDSAADFYFAIMQDVSVDDETTAVPTVDHTQYGITMKMKDFATRAEMSNFLGNDTGGMGTTLQQGLLSTQLGNDGYPIAKGGSLGTLFSGAEDVNHLFIQSTYSGTGYYEYDSTQNFATLKGNTGGNFTVYKELGTYDAADSPTRKHGQFFPYNDLKPGVFSSINSKNLCDVHGNTLPDSDPRKNEPLYLIQPRPGEQSVDCFFGMEMEASFVQTPSGYDAWGHDIIYEFTGDDDFWLYVDGELIIDLGGIHSAVPGSVNYHTGNVEVNGTHTTLKDIFYNNYIGRGHSAEDADAYIDELFEEKTNANGTKYYTFKDYTTHTMRIFYMERGAGASNLHMRFNLASVKEGHVELSKELDGIDETESILADFPYQIWYVLPSDLNNTNNIVSERLLEPDNENGISVTYKDTDMPVTYETSFVLNGNDNNGDPYTMTYDHVFLLKPGEVADIDLPDQTILYRIVECGINTNVYSDVTVNEGDEAVIAESGEGYPDNRKDYAIEYSSAKNRARVAYVNTVNHEALRTLTIRKILYDEVGATEVHDDYGTFEFRLYLDSEYSTELNLANMYTYHVRDENGNYCSWNSETGRYTALGENKNDYSQLTLEEKKAASILTSIYGSISNVPSFYTIEIRELLAGTKYKVEERDRNIPKGYSRQKYVYYEDMEDATGEDMNDPVVGLIETGKNPLVEVCNLKGYGIAVNKAWSDEDYVESRDPSYFALYCESQGSLVLASDIVDYPVLCLQQNEDSLYWYIERLAQNTVFAQYTIREVILTNPVFDENGNITAYDSITPVENGEKLNINGRLKGDTQTLPCEYTVTYSNPVLDPRNANVKSYNVTNSREGITFVKEDMEGNRLPGAVFVLSDENDNKLSEYTSDENGIITTAFLRENIEYTLEETKSPYTYRGYFGLQSPMKIMLVDGKITVTSGNALYYDISQDGKTMTIKNRIYYLRLIKTDSATGNPVGNAHFKLHKQVTVGGYTGFDFNPMSGYEDLVTGSDGIIPGIDNTLPAGTYELRETEPPPGYNPLTSYIQFTISPVGIVTLGTKHPADVTLETKIQNDTSVLYTITVPNSSSSNLHSFQLKKTNRDGLVLEGAEFVIRTTPNDPTTNLLFANNNGYYTETVSGDNATDKIIAGNVTVAGLCEGTYYLIETKPVDGYHALERSIVVQVSDTGNVTLGEGSDSNASVSGTMVTVINETGLILPATGGIGMPVIYALGFVLMLISGTFVSILLKRINH